MHNIFDIGGRTEVGQISAKENSIYRTGFV